MEDIKEASPDPGADPNGNSLGGIITRNRKKEVGRSISIAVNPDITSSDPTAAPISPTNMVTEMRRYHMWTLKPCALIKIIKITNCLLVYWRVKLAVVSTNCLEFTIQPVKAEFPLCNVRDDVGL